MLRSLNEELLGLIVAFHFKIRSIFPRFAKFKSYRLKLEFSRRFPSIRSSEIDLLSECALMLTLASIGVP